MIEQPTLIVDTATLYFRAYYGIPSTLTDAAGRPVNAVHGLLDMLARLIDHYHPSSLVCCWDGDWRPAWRVELVESYKTHRLAVPDQVAEVATELVEDALAQQVPWIRDCVQAAGISIVGAPGYEADDIAGTLARRVASRAGHAIVVSGDRDLFQLVNDKIQVAYVGRGVARHELVDDSWLLAKHGITGAQYADFATLRGDPSDGLPGVAGIGDKTANGLLTSYGNLDAIIAAACDPTSAMTTRIRQRITAATDYLARARQVVATAEVDLPELDAAVRPGRADLARCAALADEHNSRGPMRRLLIGLGEQPAS